MPSVTAHPSPSPAVMTRLATNWLVLLASFFSLLSISLSLFLLPWALKWVLVTQTQGRQKCLCASGVGPAWGGRGMETQAMPWLGRTVLGPLVFWGIHASQGISPRPPRQAHLDGRGAVCRGSCGRGLTGLLFASFLLRPLPPAPAQCLVWKGPPRIGQVSTWWLATSLVPSWAPEAWLPGC